MTFSDGDAPFVAQTFDPTALSQGRAEPSEEEVELVSSRGLRGFFGAHPGRVEAELPDGVVGDVWVRGPSVMERYLDNSRRPRRRVAGHRSCGFVLGAELYITGRRKDVIVVRGKTTVPSHSRWLWTACRVCEPGARQRCHRSSRKASACWCLSRPVPTRMRNSRSDAGPPSWRHRASIQTWWFQSLQNPSANIQRKIRRGEACAGGRRAMNPPEAVTLHLAGALAKSAWSHWTQRVSHGWCGRDWRRPGWIGCGDRRAPAEPPRDGVRGQARCDRQGLWRGRCPPR